MKRKVLIRTICTSLAVCVFAGMAMASGSSSSTKETGSVTIGDQATEAAKDPEVTTEATTKETEGKVEYEVTRTTFVHNTNSIGREEFTGVVEIKNTGSTYLYLKDCKFDFEDDDGHLLETQKLVLSSPDVVAPGEFGYFHCNGYIDENTSLENGINLVPNFTIEVCKKGQEAVIEYEVTDLDIKDGDYGMGVNVTGRVINNTSEDTNSLDVLIIAIFYDSDGEILDVATSYADEMSAGGKASFEITTMTGNDELSMETVADYKVIARHEYLQF